MLRHVNSHFCGFTPEADCIRYNMQVGKRANEKTGVGEITVTEENGGIKVNWTSSEYPHLWPILEPLV